MGLTKRLFQTLLVIVAMTNSVFIGVNMIGNTVDILISPDADQAERLRVIHQLRQYLAFVNGALNGNLGDSYVYSQLALQVILQRFPATSFELAVTAMVFSVIIGIPLGLYAGLRPQSLLAKLLMAGRILGFSLSTFWVGLMLIMVFAIQLGWLPSSGRGATVTLLHAQWSFLTLDGWQHLILLAINLSLCNLSLCNLSLCNLSLCNLSLVMRLTRAGVQEVLPQDYIRNH